MIPFFKGQEDPEKVRIERERQEQERFEREMALKRAGFGTYVILTLVVIVPAVGFALYLWAKWGPTFFAENAIWFAVFFLAEILAGLLLVARWFQRLTSNSDIEELRKMAFSYRLGGTLALRPFLNSEGEALTADSRLNEYRKGIIEPAFYKSTTNPPFFLALTLVVSLGLFAFFAPRLNLLSMPIIPLLGPKLSEWDWSMGGTVPNSDLLAYGARALVCVTFAFAGSLVWAVLYVTRRMALRDVTGHTYQEITMRLVASAVISLVVYHITARTMEASGETLMVLAFGAGVMPETALRWIGNKVARWFGSAEQNNHIDLEHIQGISAFTRARLAEVGVHDAQGLISNNPLRLSMHTPFSLPQFMDWYGQAFALLYFRPDGLRVLREHGIRTIWDVEAAGDLDDLKIREGRALNDVRQWALASLKSHPCYVRSSEIQKRMRDTYDTLSRSKGE